MVLLSVGRLRYYKGLDDLIRALPALPDTLAVIAGNGPMEAQWKALAAGMGVADRVLFTGSPTDAELPLYYQAADVYALPANSRAEALGLAVIEAMASGLPAITTEVGSGTSWVNLDGQTGLVVPPSDPRALAAAIMRLRDPALRAGFAAAARVRATGEFSHTVTFARVEALYRKTLDAMPRSI